MSPLPDPILAIANQDNRLRTLLVDWGNENSGSDHKEGLLRMAARIAAAFGSIPEAKVQHVALPGTQVPALRVSFRPGLKRRILCSGHYDTVYTAQHPFQQCKLTKEGLMNGPGVADMKGGLVIMLAALEAFSRLQAAESLGWDALLTPDEEIGSPHSGGLIRETAQGHEAALVFEPARANGDLVRSRMGTGVITVTSRGRAAHAAQQPNNGRNAIVALCDFILRAKDLPDSIPGTLLNVGNITGGGPVNVIPDLAKAEINIRATTRDAATRLRSALQTIAEAVSAQEGFSVTIDGGFERGPKESTSSEERIFARYTHGCQRLGIPIPGWQDVGGGSDGNLLSEMGIPNLDGLGVIGRNLHSPEEYCHPESLVPRAQAAALLMESLALTADWNKAGT